MATYKKVFRPAFRIFNTEENEDYRLQNIFINYIKILYRSED